MDGGKQRRKRQCLFNGRRKRKRRRRANQPSYFSPFIEERRAKKKLLPGGESNPGLPRDRRRYSPLYYRGSQHVGQAERSHCYTLQLLIEKKKAVPVRGIEPRPRRWERRILTTRPRGSWCMFGGFCQPHSFSHQVFIQPNQKCSRPGSNRGPCACEAHVITTTPREHWWMNGLSFLGHYQMRQQREKRPKIKEKKSKVLPGFEPGTFCVLGRCDNHYTTAPAHSNSGQFPDLIWTWSLWFEGWRRENICMPR